MTSKDFFKEVKLEWCASEQQDKPLLNDMMKFAKLYHQEQLILSGVSHQRELLITERLQVYFEEYPVNSYGIDCGEIAREVINCG